MVLGPRGKIPLFVNSVLQRSRSNHLWAIAYSDPREQFHDRNISSEINKSRCRDNQLLRELTSVCPQFNAGGMVLHNYSQKPRSVSLTTTLSSLCQLVQHDLPVYETYTYAAYISATEADVRTVYVLTHCFFSNSAFTGNWESECGGLIYFYWADERRDHTAPTIHSNTSRIIYI